MALDEEIKKIDRGKAFGNFGSEGKEFFLNDNLNQLSYLFEYLKNNEKNLLMADVGGGNGILSEEILRKFPFSEIDVLEIDKSKFNQTNLLNYYFHDVRNVFPKKYNCMLARSIFHYNSKEDQLRILQNMKENLFVGGWIEIIQPLAKSVEQQKDANEFYGLLSRLKGSNKKYWPTIERFKEMLSLSGLVYEIQEQKDFLYTLNGFYKERYKLNREQYDLVKERLNGRKGIELTNTIISATRFR